jgi:hypothetical protein
LRRGRKTHGKTRPGKEIEAEVADGEASETGGEWNLKNRFYPKVNNQGTVSVILLILGPS